MNKTLCRRMRFILLLSLFAVGTLAYRAHSFDSWKDEESQLKQWNGQEKSFRKNTQHRFNWDAQIATGLPLPGSQKSISRIQARILLVQSEETKALLKIEQIRFGADQKEIQDETKVQPFRLVEEIQVTEEQQQALQQPVQFRYARGLVSDLQFDSNDQVWSENIKRAILNMLQVNLAKNDLTNERTHEENNSDDFFTVTEHTLEGTCEVAYTVVEQETKSQRQPQLKVTKSVNFEKCLNRVGESYSFRFGEDCPTCNEKFNTEQSPIDSASVNEIEVIGTPEAFLITKVETSAQYVFSPVSANDAIFKTIVAARLTLIESGQKETEIQTPKGGRKVESLVYNNEYNEKRELFYMNGEDEYPAKQSPLKIKNKPELVAKLIKQIVKESVKVENGQGVQVASPHLLSRVVKVLRLTTKEEMIKIHREVCENQEYDQRTNDQLKQVLYDALAIAGTKVTIGHLVQKIRTRELPQARVVLLMNSLANVRMPSKEIIDEIMELCSEQRESPVLRQACWLSVGTLMNNMCGNRREKFAIEKREKDGYKVCNRNLKEQYTQRLYQNFEKAENRYERILALKTLANAALDVSILKLEKVIFNSKWEKTVRIEAIDALRQLRSVMPRKIQNILMPIVMDQQELPEMRMTAFHQVIQTQPDRAVLQQLVQLLKNERSHQVHVFIRTALESYAKSDIPCEQRLAEDIKTLLSTLPYEPRKYFDSVLKRYSVYSPNYLTGSTINLAALSSKDSILPKEVMVSLEAVFAGKWHKYLAQVGFSQDNLDKVIRKVLEQVEQKGLEQVLVRGKRSSSAFEPTEMLKNIFQKLSIKERFNQEDQQQPRGQLYIRYRDLDYAFVPLDENVLPESIKQAAMNGRIELDALEQMLARGLRFQTLLASFLYERSHKLVSVLGLPIVVKNSVPTVASIQGQIKVELQPNNGKNVNGARIQIQATPSVASLHVSEMAVKLPIFNQGVKIHHSAQINTPIDVTFEASWEKELRTNFVIRAPENELQLIKLQSRPLTFVKVFPKETSVYVEPREKTIYIREFEEIVHPLQKQYVDKVTGLKIKVDGHMHGYLQRPVKSIPNTWLVGENVVEVRVAPTQQTPKTYQIETVVERLDDQLPERPQKYFSGFYDKQDDEHFITEKIQETDADEQEQQRKNSFKRYLENFQQSRQALAYSIKTKIATVGGAEPKKMKVQNDIICDPQMRHCEWKMTCERSPIFAEESQNWKLEVNAQCLYPEMPQTVSQLYEQKHRELHASINARWGPELQKSIKIKVQGEQNKQQQQYVEKVVQELKREQQQPSQLQEYKQVVQAAQLNQYKFAVEYKLQQASPVLRGLIEQAYALIKSVSPLTTTIRPNQQGEQGHFRALLSIEPVNHKVLDIQIQTPRELVSVKQVALPFAPRLANIRRQYTPIRYISDLGQDLIGMNKAQCQVSSKKVETFDGVTVRQPLTTCNTVLAKDCSQESQFAVLMRKVQKNSDMKKITIMTKKDVIEVERTSEEGQFYIKVNGQKKIEQEVLENHNIQKNGDIVSVRLPEVHVEFDGKTAQIKISEEYKNRQCGICGHYDGERTNELRRADNEETEDLQQFHRSYVLSQDEDCEMDEETLSEKKNFKILSSSWMDSTEQEDYIPSIFSQRKPWQQKTQRRYEQDQEDQTEPEEKTRVIEYSNQVCFSAQAVPECPRGTYMNDNKTREMKVKFACMPRQSSEAARLMRQARHEILSLESIQESYVETLVVPRECIFA